MPRHHAAQPCPHGQWGRAGSIDRNAAGAALPARAMVPAARLLLWNPPVAGFHGLIYNLSTPMPTTEPCRSETVRILDNGEEVIKEGINEAQVYQVV